MLNLFQHLDFYRIDKTLKRVQGDSDNDFQKYY